MARAVGGVSSSAVSAGPADQATDSDQLAVRECSMRRRPYSSNRQSSGRARSVSMATAIAAAFISRAAACAEDPTTLRSRSPWSITERRPQRHRQVAPDSRQSSSSSALWALFSVWSVGCSGRRSCAGFPAPGGRALHHRGQGTEGRVGEPRRARRRLQRSKSCRPRSLNRRPNLCRPHATAGVAEVGSWRGKAPSV